MTGFLNFTASDDTSLDFMPAGSYGEGIPADWNSLILPESIIGHGVTFPGEPNGLMHGVFPNMTSQSMSEISPYSVPPQHLYTQLQSPSPSATGPSPEHLSNSRTTQSGGQHEFLFHMGAMHDTPIIPGRFDTSRPPNGNASFALAPSASFNRRTSRPPRPPPGVHFGSDPNFNNGEFYVPSSLRETTEHIAATQLATLSCLERNPSAAPTRAPSPVQLPVLDQVPKTIPEQLDGDPHHLPIKRLKSSKPDDEQAANIYSPAPLSIITTSHTSPPVVPPSPSTTPASATSRKRGSTAVTSPQDTPPASAGKRKRSSAATPKPPRENLTDEQKRNNHIKSEQKRRNVIKEGFDELNRVIPSLKGGGFSKALMLTHTADFLEKLHHGNEELRKILRKNPTNKVNGATNAESIGSSSK